MAYSLIATRMPSASLLSQKLSRKISTDWSKAAQELLTFDCIEFFPYQTSNSAEQIGICIPLKNTERMEIHQQIRGLVAYLHKKRYVIYDLYQGKIVSKDDVEALIFEITGGLLPPE